MLQTPFHCAACEAVQLVLQQSIQHCESPDQVHIIAQTKDFPEAAQGLRRQGCQAHQGFGVQAWRAASFCVLPDACPPSVQQPCMLSTAYTSQSGRSWIPYTESWHCAGPSRASSNVPRILLHTIHTGDQGAASHPLLPLYLWVSPTSHCTDASAAHLPEQCSQVQVPAAATQQDRHPGPHPR